MRPRSGRGPRWCCRQQQSLLGGVELHQQCPFTAGWAARLPLHLRVVIQEEMPGAGRPRREAAFTQSRDELSEPVRQRHCLRAVSETRGAASRMGPGVQHRNKHRLIELIHQLLLDLSLLFSLNYSEAICFG